MADTSTPAAQTQQPAPAPRKRKRRWLRIILVLVLLLVIGLGLLVAFLPTIASTAAVRNAVLSQANSLFLVGKVDVADWKFNWRSGQTISGIQVYDDKQSLVLEIAKVTTDASIIDAAKSKSFGKLKVEGLNANIRRHPDGALNVEHIAKVDPDKQKSSKPKSASSDEIEIPNITGELEIVDGRATLSGEPGVPTVEVTGLNGTIKLPGGDAAIENKLDLTAAVGDGPAGKISVSGTLSAIKNGKLVIDTVDGQQTIAITGLDLAAATPLLGKDAPISSVKGKTDGNLVATLKGGKEASVEGKLTVAGLAASGPALKGDTFASDTTEIVLPTIVVTMPNGPTDVDAMRVKTGSGPEQPVTVTLQQGKATVFADASLASILKAIDGNAPGDTGKAVVDANFDIGKLADGLRNTFKLVEGVNLTGGQLASRSTIDINPAALVLASNTSLTGVAGTNAGKPVQLQPIKLDVAATAGGGGNLLASIRDVKLDLASAFANGSFSGPTLAGINGKLDGALDKVQAELGQVIDFGKVKLSGAFAVNIATKGDLTKTLTEPAELSAGLTVDNLNVSGLSDQPINQSQIQGNLVARISTDEKNVPRDVNVTKAFLRTGTLAEPTIVADAVASLALGSGASSLDVSSFTVRQFVVDLPRLGNELGAIVPAIRNLGGQVSATLTGSATNVLGEPQITIAQLRVGHSDDLFSLTSNGGMPLSILMPKGAALPHANGTLELRADLAKLNAQMKRLTGGKELAVQTSAGDVRSGALTGTLVLARAGNNATSAAADLVASNLVLSTPTGQQQFQPLTIAFKASAGDDLSSATVENASITGDLLTASATNTRIVLKDPANPAATVEPLKMLQSADVSLSIPNLAPVYVLANAFVAPTPTKPGEKPAEPLRVTGGTFATKAKVTQGPDGMPNVNVSELRGERIGVAQGTSVIELASLAGTQTITPSGDLLSPKGAITLKGVKVTDNGKPVFAEDQVDLTNDLSVDLNKSDATINAFTLKMVSSQALSLSAKGAVHDYANTRKFDNLTADVDYDLAEIWKLAKPFVATEPDSIVNKATMSGKVQRQFTVNGQLPANLPFNEAIKQVVATGAVAVPLAELEGSKLENLELPITVQNGIATLSSPPAKFNDGALDLGGITVDLTDTVAPRLTIPANKQLLSNATLNPFLADKVIGNLINPAFTGARQAKGLIELKALTVDRVALDPEILQGLKPAADTGNAELSLSVKDLEIGGTVIQLIQLADPGSQGFNGEINDGRIRYKSGVVNSDITLQLKQNQKVYPVRLAGNVGLANFNLSPFVATIPTDFIQRLGGDLRKYFPDSIDVTFRGTSIQPQLRVDEIVGKLIQDAGKKAITDQLLGKAKDAAGVDDKSKDGTKTDKKEDTVEDAIGDLLKGLTKDKDKKKKK